MRKTALLTLSFFSILFSIQGQEINAGGIPGACSVNEKKSPVPLDGNGSLGQSFNQSACGLNYVAATQIVQTRYLASPGCGTGPCTWTITGLPPCITPVKALVWANVSYQSGPPVGTISITNPLSNTNSYSASPVGTSVSKCWGEIGTAIYRWDVTSSIANNGNYTFSFSGFSNPTWEIDGATIFIIYRDLSATYDGSLIFWDGAIATQGFQTVSQTLTGFTVCATPSLAKAFMITSDHQDNVAATHTSTMNGVAVTFPNSFSNFQNANTTLTNGQSSTNFADSDNGTGDCFLWSMAGLYYQSNCTSCTPQGLSVTQSSTPAPCGNSTGSATVNPTGGVGPYTYVWTPAVAGNTNTATGLAAGSYTVAINDAVGCSTVITVVVNGSAGPAATATATATGCTVNNGTATATPTGGTPGYTYQWSPSGGNAQTASNLTAGIYTVTVTDANGCSTQSTATVTTANGPTTTSSVNSNVSCFGGFNGSATTTPSGGTPGYTYQWSPTGGISQTASNLPAGNYTVTVTDANGCSYTDNITITQPTALALSNAHSNVLCNGGGGATATVTVTGGTPGYSYSWNTLPVQTTSTATNLSAGNYQCIVTDSKGCTSVTSVTITQPSPLTASTSHINVTCSGGNNGSATATMNGGTAPYTYAWNTIPPQNTQTATGLSSGTYSVIITDANGCTAPSSATVTQPTPVALTISCGDSICIGDSTVLSATASGGNPSYTYAWSPASQSGSAVYVSPTTNTSYTVTVTDANGCTAPAQNCIVAVLPSPTALFDSASTGTYSSVYSFNDLSTGGISWSWNFGDGTNGSSQQNPVHTFPGAGTYTVTQVVFNQYGCPDTFKLVITVDEGILIPNVFTPDGNGQNDVWYIPNSGMKEFHVEIYDRWGALVWETTADEIRWDGRSSSGKLLSDGTYYFVLHAILKSGSKGKDYSTTGWVTLLTENRKK